jgi:hypothetical protein
VAHSQGTALTFLTLSKHQFPGLGSSLSCVVALSPAVFAGPLLSRFMFSFVKVLGPRMYRLIFGINAFIPLMMVFHGFRPRKLYGWLGYRIFNYLFAWTDLRWERRLRNRFFQIAPVYVSAECMYWWLGRGSPSFNCGLTQTALPNGGVYCLRPQVNGTIRVCHLCRCTSEVETN